MLSKQFFSAQTSMPILLLCLDCKLHDIVKSLRSSKFKRLNKHLNFSGVCLNHAHSSHGDCVTKIDYILSWKKSRLEFPRGNEMGRMVVMHFSHSPELRKHSLWIIQFFVHLGFCNLTPCARK